MLLDPQTLDLAPRASDVLGIVEGDGRFCPELHAAQLEITTAPAASVDDALAQLRAARQELVERTAGWLRIATAGVHPFAERAPSVSEGDRYQRIAAEYGRAAVEAAVFGIHVHVAIDGADRAVAIHDALREYLPIVAVLAGNGPFHNGVDTGFASLRPKLSEALPRQGVPPVLGSWEHWCELVRWGQRSRVYGPQELWWEVRLHPRFGTIEVRVADAQCRAEDAGAIVGLITALVHHLSNQYDAGTLQAPVRTELVEENRWRALRYGLDGSLLDVRTAETTPSRQRVLELLETLGPAAERAGCTAHLARAATLAERNGAERQRAVAAEHGLDGLVGWMADGFEA